MILFRISDFPGILTRQKMFDKPALVKLVFFSLVNSTNILRELEFE
jgi:hypothetical protein